jgi:flagellar biosynthesis protein FliQ
VLFSTPVAEIPKSFLLLFFKKEVLSCFLPSSPDRLAAMPIYLTLLWQALLVEVDALTPIIFVLLVVGVVTAIFQAAFQIEDTTFSLIPKLFVMLAIPFFGGYAAMHAFSGLAIDWISHAGATVRLSWN